MSPLDLARATEGPLPELTNHTITDHEEFAAELELERVHAEGIAYDREEESEEICAVGTSAYFGSGIQQQYQQATAG